MSARMQQRGHEVYFDYTKEEWLYSDDNSSVNNERHCKKCNHLPFSNGVDYCLGMLSDCKGIISACCGHGNDEDAYILLKDGRRFVLDKRLDESGDKDD